MASATTAPIVLRDGTRFADLHDRDARTFRARVHSDEEIFDLELQRIFARAWVPVAHVSEFRRSGDFVTRAIGLDPVLVTRDDDSDDGVGYHVMLNACTHRGAQVCSAEAGNSPTHRCPFHAWTFGVDGALVGVPSERSVYGERLDRSALRLRQARVAVRAGLIFANWSADAPSLDEYLGDFAFYLDAMLDRTDGGMEVAGPPQRYVVDANWKVVTEGFFGDAYHVPSVHQSFVDIELYSRNEAQFFKISENGHGLLCADLQRMGLDLPPEQVLAMVPPPGTPAELVPEVLQKVSPDQVTLLGQTPPFVMGIWPSTSVLQISSGPRSPIKPTVSIRFFVPVSPHRTEFVSFAIVDRDAPQEFKDESHRWTISSFGVGGMFEADDVEVWQSVQRTARGAIGRQMTDRYQSRAEPYADDVRPGRHRYRGVHSDDLVWHFYERYFEMMEEA